MSELEKVLEEATKTYNALSEKKQEAEAVLYKINEDLARVQKLIQTLRLTCPEDNRFNNSIEQ